MKKYLKHYQNLNNIYQEIITSSDNIAFVNQGWKPLYVASPLAKILLVGQAPGLKTQSINMLWNDISGKRLRGWLGIEQQTFYNPDIFAHLPMDFFYPGRGKNGDLPPRKDFAKKWHPQILQWMPNIKLIILIGQYAQKYYLQSNYNVNTTLTVKNYDKYLPRFFPIIHPSPQNLRWISKNKWFESDVLPKLKDLVYEILSE